MNLISSSLTWFFGIIFLFLGAMSLANSVWFGVIFVIVGLVLIPPIRLWFYQTVDDKVHPHLPFILGTGLLVIGLMTFDSPNNKPQVQNTKDISTVININTSEPLSTPKSPLLEEALITFDSKGVLASQEFIREHLSITAPKELEKLISFGYAYKDYDKDSWFFDDSFSYCGIPVLDDIELETLNKKNIESIFSRIVELTNAVTISKYLQEAKALPASETLNNAIAYSKVYCLDPSNKQALSKAKRYSNKYYKEKELEIIQGYLVSACKTVAESAAIYGIDFSLGDKSQMDQISSGLRYLREVKVKNEYGVYGKNNLVCRSDYKGNVVQAYLDDRMIYQL